MILGFLSRIPAIVWVLAVLVVVSLILFKQIQASGALEEQLKSVQLEKDRAETEKARLVESDRKHAAALAAARKSYADAARRLAAVPDDGCLDRPVSPGVADVLRMHKGRKANPPRPSRPQADSGVEGKNVPRPD